MHGFLAKLIIKRSSEYINRLRGVGIYPDGKKIATIGNGEVTEISVPDGQHRFLAKIDWCNSLELLIDFNSSASKTMFLSSFGYKNRFFTISVIGLALWYIAMAFTDVPFPLNIIPPVFVMSVLLYYITFGRRKFLVVHEVAGV